MFKLAIATDSKLLVHQINQKSHTNLQSIDVKAKQVIWSPDNTTLLALSNQLIFIDETSTSIKMEQFHLTSSIATFGTKSGRYLYLVNETKVIVLDRKEKKIVEDLQFESVISCIAITSDDSRIACGLVNGTIMTHSLKHKTSTLLESQFQQAVTSLSFYPFKKSILVAGSQDGSIKMWDVNASMKPIAEKSCHSAPITCIGFAPCNKHFFCSVGLDGRLLFHNLDVKKPILQEYQCKDPILTMSINDEHLVCLGTSSGTILFYDLRAKDVVYSIVEQGRIVSLAFQSPKWAVSASIKDAVLVQVPEQVEAISVEPVKEKKQNHMDMFSPVHQKAVKQVDLRKTAVMTRFNDRLKQESGVTSLARTRAQSLIGSSRGQGGQETLMRQVKSDDVLNRESVRTPLPVPARTPEGHVFVKDPFTEEPLEKVVERVPVEQIQLQLPQAVEPQAVEQPPKLVEQLPKPLKDKLNIEKIQDQMVKESVEQVEMLGGLVGVGTKTNTKETKKETQFQYQVLKSIVEDVVQEHFENLHEQIQDLHIEMMRQFQIQRVFLF